MLHALHSAGHKYLKLLFVLALASSSTLFFVGSVVPRPPGLVVILVGTVLGIALEWGFFTVSCDLTESISERNTGAIARDLLYTIVGGVASWFLFTNAALHVGWAPIDELLGLSRQQWAMILAALIVLVIFALSARRERPKDATDLQAIARAVQMLLPDAPDGVRLHLLSTIASEAAKLEAPPVSSVRPALPPPLVPTVAPVAPSQETLVVLPVAPDPASQDGKGGSQSGDPFRG